MLCAACGSPGAATPDAGPPDVQVQAACTATWSGNFADVATAATPCAAMTGSTLAITAPSSLLMMPLPISVELAAPVAGSYTPSNVTAWSASEVRMIVGNSCAFEAGSTVAPHGDFTLTLADAAAPHGTLALDLTVLAETASTCGTPLTEHLELAF